jgi:hypothetical protein
MVNDIYKSMYILCDLHLFFLFTWDEVISHNFTLTHTWHIYQKLYTHTTLVITICDRLWSAHTKDFKLYNHSSTKQWKVSKIATPFLKYLSSQMFLTSAFEWSFTPKSGRVARHHNLKKKKKKKKITCLHAK